MCETLTSTRLDPTLAQSALGYVEPPEFELSVETDDGHETDSATNLDLTLESERLKTFKNWTSTAISGESLAKAGFYFLNKLNKPDLVKCYYCKAEICRWERDDDALQEHIRWSPNCSFVKERVQKPAMVFFRAQEPGQDVCGNAEIVSASEIESFNYNDQQVRLKSFESWPEWSKQEPEDLADAGFYYRGVEDHTICYKCGGALRSWKDDDDPWEQHAMCFPRCTHVLAQKGQEYVNEVQAKLKSSLPCNSNVTKEESANSVVILCVICNSNERNVIFSPCNHIVACSSCSKSVENCPKCQTPIENSMKVFLS